VTFQGGTDTLAFQTYLTEILLPNLWKGACVVMDNFSSHKVVGIKEAIEAVGAKLVYLPPYSPDFNPMRTVGRNLRSIYVPKLLEPTKN